MSLENQISRLDYSLEHKTGRFYNHEQVIKSKVKLFRGEEFEGFGCMVAEFQDDSRGINGIITLPFVPFDYSPSELKELILVCYDEGKYKNA